MVNFFLLGPKWKPFVGCLFEVKYLISKLGLYHLVWETLADTFGPVVGLRLGRDIIVLISGQATIKKVLLNEDFDARPDGFFFRLRSFKKRLGIVFVEGEHFQEQKKFCLMALKKLGMGKKVMEDIIGKEAEELVASLRCKQRECNIFQMANIFDIAVLNSLWALMAGERFSLNNKKLTDLIDLVHEAFKLIDMSGGLLNQMPFLRFVAPNATGYSRVSYVLEKLNNFLKATVLEHQKNLGEEPNDLIDLFLCEMRDRIASGEKSTFTDEQLIVLLLDFFMAGTETTSNTLSMAMLYMILFPEVQEKVQRSLDEVVPRSRLPTLQDRPNLKYVEAVLFEVQRFGTIVPTSVPHRTTKDVHLEGFVIPKDTMILINLRSVLMDKERWMDPTTFRPERFLDEKGQLTQNECFIPFGQGRRRCLGEGLARSSMFLLFSAVLQNFKVLKADDEFSNVPLDGVTLSPKPYKAILQPR
ncbi:hypothetical protein RUM44_006431 [Polyplax serrata]|uniref:Cytochrome P450 n=1 Tax=Polyplax serrata TaxID=468196 RepID=A0ABR1AJT6_POLSC